MIEIKILNYHPSRNKFSMKPYAALKFPVTAEFNLDLNIFGIYRKSHGNQTSTIPPS